VVPGAGGHDAHPAHGGRRPAAAAVATDADPAEPKKRSPWTWPLVALIVLLLLVLGGTLFALFANQKPAPAETTSSAPSSPPPSKTPSASPTVANINLGAIELKGKTCDEAKSALTAAGFTAADPAPMATPPRRRTRSARSTRPTRAAATSATVVTLTFYADQTPMAQPGADAERDPVAAGGSSRDLGGLLVPRRVHADQLRLHRHQRHVPGRRRHRGFLPHRSAGGHHRRALGDGRRELRVECENSSGNVRTSPSSAQTVATITDAVGGAVTGSTRTRSVRLAAECCQGEKCL
jgi:hypothetical protein